MRRLGGNLGKQERRYKFLIYIAVFLGVATLAARWIGSRPRGPVAQEELDKQGPSELVSLNTEEPKPKEGPTGGSTTRVRQIDPKEAAKMLDQRTLWEAGLSPRIDVSFQMPPWTNYGYLSASLENGWYAPHENWLYHVPVGTNEMGVCYGSSGNKDCRIMPVHAGNNGVPLTELEITRPEYFGLRCDLTEYEKGWKREIFLGERDSPAKTTTVIWPGEYRLSCDVTGGAHADNLTASVASYSGAASVSVSAPESASVVRVLFDVLGDQVNVRATTSQY